MNFENSTGNSLAKESVVEGEQGVEMTEAAIADLSTANANIEEIKAMDQELVQEKLSDPEKQDKVRNLLGKLKEYGAIIASGAMLAGSSVYAALNGLEVPETEQSMLTPQSISAALILVSTVIGIVAVMHKKLVVDERKVKA
ncbi:MAG: hypothetical protein NT165_01945 [Candidatus Falkowbacteria bacterium]|nr:hypothetical protein [Candidatus Falkowbacteria bacterium]